MSTRMIGLVLKGDVLDASTLREQAASRLAPWHIDWCRHDEKPCGCPGWRYDILREPVCVMALAFAEPQAGARLFNPAGVMSWLNLHDEWYDRPDCVDFEQVIWTDISRAEAWSHVVCVLPIHYF